MNKEANAFLAGAGGILALWLATWIFADDRLTQDIQDGLCLTQETISVTPEPVVDLRGKVLVQEPYLMVKVHCPATDHLRKPK